MRADGRQQLRPVSLKLQSEFLIIRQTIYLIIFIYYTEKLTDFLVETQTFISVMKTSVSSSYNK